MGTSARLLHDPSRCEESAKCARSSAVRGSGRIPCHHEAAESGVFAHDASNERRSPERDARSRERARAPTVAASLRSSIGRINRRPSRPGRRSCVPAHHGTRAGGAVAERPFLAPVEGRAHLPDHASPTRGGGAARSRRVARIAHAGALDSVGRGLGFKQECRPDRSGRRACPRSSRRPAPRRARRDRGSRHDA